MKLFFKIFALVFAVLFSWAVYVQYNDPDSYLWYTIYGLAAIASLLFFFEKLPFWAPIILAALYLIGMFLDWPAHFEGVTIGGGDIKDVEEGRESLGLLINAAVMLLYAWRIKVRQKH